MKKALLIGINDYPEGNELTGCIEDINSVKAAIERHGDGSPNFGVKMMPNVQTSGEVMDAIHIAMPRKIKESSIIISCKKFTNSIHHFS